jgi:hypothetical protein
MDARDEAGFNGDETLDWLWDLDDRYDVGALDDDPTGGSKEVPTAAAAGSGVKKHLRKQRVLVGDGAAVAAGDEMGPDDGGEETAAIATPFLVGGKLRSPLRDRLIHDGRLTRGGIAAAIVLFLAFGGIAFSVLNRGGGSNHPSNRVAISPTTDTTTPQDTTVAQPPTSDTTPTTAVTTTPVAAVTPTGTTVFNTPTTVRSCARTARLLSIMTAATTDTSSTTASTTPSSTTPPTSATTTPPTLPATTTTAVPRTTPTTVHITPPPPPPPPPIPRPRGC